MGLNFVESDRTKSNSHDDSSSTERQNAYDSRHTGTDDIFVLGSGNVVIHEGRPREARLKPSAVGNGKTGRSFVTL